ncbi:MAG: HU family DNA-binding protein [Nitrospinota bacterium]|nr:MAG: HU family DNA-binding protein [Nitrospinota bacterium]
MNRADLVAKIAKDAGITKKAAEKAIGSFIEGVKDALSRGENVTLVGFGTFSVAERAARKGRNPQTGAEIQIPASKTPKFKAGRDLREAVK